MLIVQNTLVSDDFVTERFCCNYSVCKGLCCVEGDAGAPLEEIEIKNIETFLEKIFPFMSEQGIKEIKEKGVYVFDPEGNKVTPLINGRECVFAVYDNNTAICSIELAYNKGFIPFQKPISCHLYPARITDYKDFLAINYHKWHICQSAIACGKDKDIPLYKFLKEAFTRKFGKEWYDELCKIIDYISNKKPQDPKAD